MEGKNNQLLLVFTALDRPPTNAHGATRVSGAAILTRHA